MLERREREYDAEDEVEEDIVRGEGGGGVDIDKVGFSERLPEVVYGVMSKTSGKMRRMEFLLA